jgi:crotonobetainyl-CoA:carnitine CoA-transferase CaiB-like acyl-CoA transferase
MQVPPPRTGPLVGLKVLEIGHYIAAPFCTRILADLGAEVIKVEPPGGDPFRGWGASVDGHSVWFSVHGRNKLSVVLDLKRDRDTVLRLAARADVLVENLRAGGLERLGLGPEALHAVNPRLVIARISGYGQDGPYRDKPAFGAIGEAMGGIRHRIRPAVRICRRRAAASRSATIWQGCMLRSGCSRRCGSAMSRGPGAGGWWT